VTECNISLLLALGALGGNRASARHFRKVSVNFTAHAEFRTHPPRQSGQFPVPSHLNPAHLHISATVLGQTD